MMGEGMLYCLQSRLWGRGGGPGGAEGSINAGGCNFNSFLRRTVRFVGESLNTPTPHPHPGLGRFSPQLPHSP